VNWDYHFNGLPDWLAQHVRDFIAHKLKGCPPDERHRRTVETLSHVCLTLRWMAQATTLTGIGDLTPMLWFDFMDAQLAAGYHPNTVNNRLFRLKALLHFLHEAGCPVCPRMLLVESIKTGPHIPKDVPIAQLHRLLAEIECEAEDQHATKRRMGVLDRAWVHLTLAPAVKVQVCCTAACAPAKCAVCVWMRLTGKAAASGSNNPRG
jgi:site-specific recombinase XerD